MWFAPWIPLVVAAVTDTTDRQTRSLPLPDGRALAVEVTVGSVRVEGWDKAEIEVAIERHVPTAAGQARLAEHPANARILALALNGNITSTIPLTMKDTWGPRWGEATFGAGEPVISLDVVTGSIEIRSP